MRRVLPLLAFFFSASALAAPAPPPAPAVAQLYQDFFAAMPKSFPAKETSALEALVAADVTVTMDGAVKFTSRTDWLAWLQSMAVEGDVDSTSMSREEFFYQREDRILVKEFWWPHREGTVFHPEFPHKIVSYQFKDLKLVRVDYIAEMRPMMIKPGEAK